MRLACLAFFSAWLFSVSALANQAPPEAGRNQVLRAEQSLVRASFADAQRFLSVTDRANKFKKLDALEQIAWLPRGVPALTSCPQGLSAPDGCSSAPPYVNSTLTFQDPTAFSDGKFFQTSQMPSGAGFTNGRNNSINWNVAGVDFAVGIAMNGPYTNGAYCNNALNIPCSSTPGATGLIDAIQYFSNIATNGDTANTGCAPSLSGYNSSTTGTSAHLITCKSNVTGTVNLNLNGFDWTPSDGSGNANCSRFLFQFSGAGPTGAHVSFKSNRYLMNTGSYYNGGNPITGCYDGSQVAVFRIGTNIAIPADFDIENNWIDMQAFQSWMQFSPTVINGSGIDGFLIEGGALTSSGASSAFTGVAKLKYNYFGHANSKMFSADTCSHQYTSNVIQDIGYDWGGGLHTEWNFNSGNAYCGGNPATAALPFVYINNTQWQDATLVAPPAAYLVISSMGGGGGATVAATQSWLANATTITTATLGSNANIKANYGIYDQTTGSFVGIVSSYVGNTITLSGTGAQSASSGSSDSLIASQASPVTTESSGTWFTFSQGTIEYNVQVTNKTQDAPNGNLSWYAGGTGSTYNLNSNGTGYNDNDIESVNVTYGAGSTCRATQKFYIIHTATANFTASISTSNVMTVTAVNEGTINVGDVIDGANAGTTILSNGTGLGGIGTYNVSGTYSSALSSRTMISNQDTANSYISRLSTGMQITTAGSCLSGSSSPLVASEPWSTTAVTGSGSGATVSGMNWFDSTASAGIGFAGSSTGAVYLGSSGNPGLILAHNYTDVTGMLTAAAAFVSHSPELVWCTNGSTQTDNVNMLTNGALTPMTLTSGC